MKTRREFLKDTCTACLGTAFLGLTSTQLTSCSSLPIYKTNLSQKSIPIPLASFGESNLMIVRDMNMPYDLLVVKKSEQEYVTLFMKCTHQENPVTANTSGLYCASHGSSFDLDGNVTKEPALQPLKKFKTERMENQLLIDLNS